MWRVAGIVASSLKLEGYNRSGTRRRHLAVIRQHLGVNPYGPAARHAMVRALGEAASTKHELEDLINVAIEQLVRQRFEPAGLRHDEIAQRATSAPDSTESSAGAYFRR